jgi:hypothetical protein
MKLLTQLIVLMFVSIVTFAQEIETQRIDGIAKVFMNTTKSYTLIVRDEVSGNYMPINIDCKTPGAQYPHSKIVYIPDLKENESMFLEKHFYKTDGLASYEVCVSLEIHIRNVDNINGGAAKHHGLKHPSISTKDLYF